MSSLTYLLAGFLVFTYLPLPNAFAEETYPIVDTGQSQCYGNSGPIPWPKPSQPFYGQDAQFQGRALSYQDNGDGTVTDLVTGLMWQKTPGQKLTWDQAMASVDSFNQQALGGHQDWRVPTIKELYSLILFIGTDPRPDQSSGTGEIPYLDTTYFDFSYGDPSKGERVIDAQYWSATPYVSGTMNNQRTAFGVNFADGRIKGYGVDPIGPPGKEWAKTAFVRYVRGNTNYGINHFTDNGDGTISDSATGLMWSKSDSGSDLNWENALRYAVQNRTGGYNDWRLPNAKELQSIVDYTRSPDSTHSPAIDPLFEVTSIHNEGGALDYPYYWTGTTHSSAPGHNETAVYIAFGRALGYMSVPPGSSTKQLLDVHGAGAQRTDLKAGDPASLPKGRGPQGDVMRIYNYVRLVRGGGTVPATPTKEVKKTGTKSSSAQDQFIRRLDRNGDGKISPEEFDGPADRFSDFDRNHDGVISADEAPTGPPPR